MLKGNHGTAPLCSLLGISQWLAFIDLRRQSLSTSTLSWQKPPWESETHDIVSYKPTDCSLSPDCANFNFISVTFRAKLNSHLFRKEFLDLEPQEGLFHWVDLTQTLPYPTQWKVWSVLSFFPVRLIPQQFVMHGN